ncbi:uncharacterized protein BJ171DRAFT_82014 [Polychytrium aggregatum]|uniref:uncharacterized protein n=1 Tax=Polychytrium aggregatum TaxID=110093 RepID=UPI0022FE83C4|nr:uncharacterized protein BJ171DRAFT_82014 [Polychytrium aggregatum]KAI9205025.1 hypothetical protein BJ171DRAFT_82014 [Polychytrium aggregatum]
MSHPFLALDLSPPIVRSERSSSESRNRPPSTYAVDPSGSDDEQSCRLSSPSCLHPAPTSAGVSPIARHRQDAHVYHDLLTKIHTALGPSIPSPAAPTSHSNWQVSDGLAATPHPSSLSAGQHSPDGSSSSIKIDLEAAAPSLPSSRSAIASLLETIKQAIENDPPPVLPSNAPDPQPRLAAKPPRSSTLSQPPAAPARQRPPLGPSNQPGLQAATPPVSMPREIDSLFLSHLQATGPRIAMPRIEYESFVSEATEDTLTERRLEAILRRYSGK